ncbi:Uncharacterised protein [Chlamydia abortus]|nr:Uncharacterised protein [Chlamydia abortus]
MCTEQAKPISTCSSELLSPSKHIICVCKAATFRMNRSICILLSQTKIFPSGAFSKVTVELFLSKGP